MDTKEKIEQYLRQKGFTQNENNLKEWYKPYKENGIKYGDIVVENDGLVMFEFQHVFCDTLTVDNISITMFHIKDELERLELGL